MASNIQSPKHNGLNGAAMYASPLTNMEVVVKEECYEVSIEFGETTYEQINVELHDRILVIEYGDGSEREQLFQQTYDLPDDAIGSEILASFEAGVLTVYVPRELG